MNKKKIKISIILNIIITILVIMASVMMYTGFRFMHGKELILDVSKLAILKFFTVQSNLLMGIVAFMFLLEEIKVLKGKIENISKKNYILKLMSTTAVSLTCLVVFVYLGPNTEYGILSLLMNSNLFFHLIIPVLSIITFIFFEKTNSITFKNTFYGIIPTILYELFYIVNVLLHIENGKVSIDYDWYWFAQNGIWLAVIIGPIMILITYLICLVLWKGNKK